jgi:hypothetical protein
VKPTSQCVNQHRAIPGKNLAVSDVAPIATKMARRDERRFVPLATDAPQQTASLFDRLIGAADQRQRHGDAERLRGLEIDDQLDLSGLLDRQVGRLRALS